MRDGTVSCPFACDANIRLALDVAGITKIAGEQSITVDGKNTEGMSGRD